MSLARLEIYESVDGNLGHEVRNTVSLVVVAGTLRALDMITIYATAATLHLIYRTYLSGAELADWRYYHTTALMAVFFAGTIFHWNGVYRQSDLTVSRLKVRRLTWSWGAVALCLIVGAFLFKISSDFSRVWGVSWFICALAGMTVWRVGLVHLVRRWVIHGQLTCNIAIVGGGRHAQQLIETIHHRDDRSLRIIGFFDDRGDRVPQQIDGSLHIGTVKDLVTYARCNRVDQIIVALPWSAECRVMQVLTQLRSLPIDVRLAPDLVGFHLGSERGYTHVCGVALLDVSHRPLSDWHLVIKKIEDYTFAAILLSLLGPLFLIIAAAIKLDSPGPVFFRQKRHGFNNRLIRVYKFRTMYHHMRDETAAKLVTRNDPRVTRIGAFLRKTSIDEIPQLINVMRGEMSIVGPRPHALAAKAGDRSYEEVVTEYAARHRVKPGITGWAQVMGWRGETDTVEKIRKRVEHDLYYIENWSLAFDLKILVMTPFVVLNASNVY